MTNKRLYFAYGSNMDLQQMKHRCPNSKRLHTARLKGFDFIINSRGVASLIENPESFVEGLLWELTEECERSLDHYEGVSEGHYWKHYVVLPELGEQEILVYVASDQQKAFKPREGYFEKIMRAADLAGLDANYLLRLRGYFQECGCQED